MHRTVYLPIVRDQVPDVLTLFDFPDPSLLIGERPTTTIPAQSLYLMNNPFVIRQAEALAEKLLAGDGEGDDAAQADAGVSALLFAAAVGKGDEEGPRIPRRVRQEAVAPGDVDGAVSGAVLQRGVRAAVSMESSF